MQSNYTVALPGSVYGSLLPASDTTKMVIPLDELMGALCTLRSCCFMNLKTREAENE